MAEEKTYAMNRIKSAEHVWVPQDVPDACRGECKKPQQSDGAEERRHARRTVRLYGKQSDQDQHRQGNNIGLQRRCHDLQALDRRQHRDRRRDHRVAVKESGADHAKRDHHKCAASADSILGEGHQGERSTLAVIVRAQQDDHVFDADDEDKRPDDQRQDAENDSLAHRHICTAGGQHRFAECIKRARADVAVDDADRTKRQRPEREARTHRHLSAVGGRKV